MGYGQADQADREMMALALGQARVSLESGGVPVGAVLAAARPGRRGRAQRAACSAATPVARTAR